MKDNLVNGWYKCVGRNNDWTKGKLYYFENGFTKDDKGVCRPTCVWPQKYNDPASEYWFEWVGLVPADKKEVEKMKHDTMNDSRINGFYKATKTNADWYEGRQYYFRDGYTINDGGDTRPCGEPLKYWTSRTRDWLKKEGLVPATDEMDIFNRVNEAAVNGMDVCDCEDCVNCPYVPVRNCRTQMIDDFKALRKMLENRKEQNYEAMPIQGGFVHDNKKADKKPVLVGRWYRDKETFEVFKVVDIGVLWKDRNRVNVAGIQIKMEGIDTGFKMVVNKFDSADEFYEDFERWDVNNDGGSFNFVALEDLSSENHSKLFKKGHLYSVVEGRVYNCDCDMRFKDFFEMESYFGGGKLIRTVGQGLLDDPTDGLYTGMAVFKREKVICSRDNWQFTKGKIYRFVNGIAMDDTGSLTVWRNFGLLDYFAPVDNLKVEGD